MHMNPHIENKIKGLIFGQAIGDAFGLGTEFMSKSEIHSHYPDGFHHYDQIVQDDHRKRWQKGNWTDDTDQFLCILKSLIEHQSVNALDIAGKFKAWLDEDGMGIGQTTYKVLTLPEYIKYPKKGAELVWKIKNKAIAPNGALMRNGIACSFMFWDSEEVLDNCASICQLTHFDPRCVDSCKLMAHLILGELNDTPVSWEKLSQLMEGYDPRIKAYINPPSSMIDDLQLDDQKSVGYTLKALNAGIWSYYNSDSFLETLHAIIMEGGDADTNGCIAGSILGAKFGYNNLPEKLIEGLNRKDELEELSSQYIEMLSSLQP